MIHELISRLFQTRDAEHRALEKFYVDSVELIDTFVECYQGAFGKIGVFDLEKVDYDGKIVTSKTTDSSSLIFCGRRSKPRISPMIMLDPPPLDVP